MSGTFLNIQALRAVAAIGVAYDHVQAMTNAAFGMSVDSSPGAFGVDLFFVISGFVMILSRQRAMTSIGSFMAGRLIRIVPLYWLATMAIVAIYQAGFRPAGLLHFEPSMLLQSLFFVTTLFPDGRHDLILSSGWTLIYELFFYLVLATTFTAHRPARSLALVAGIFMLLVTLGQVVPGIPHRIAFFLSPILFEFVFGGVLALIVLRLDARGIALPAITVPVAVAIIAAGVVLLVGADVAGLGVPETNGGRAWLWGVPAMLIVGSFVALERCGWRIGNRLVQLAGAASYALYLFHPLVMQATVKVVAVLVPIGGAAGAVVAGLAAMIAAIIAAMAIHLVIERPILDLGRRALGGSPVVPTIRTVQQDAPEGPARRNASP